MLRFGGAFSAAMKRLKLLESKNHGLVIQSLHEIFEIMCFQNAFESPLILCAAYISLCKIGKFGALQSLILEQNTTNERSIGLCFGKLVSNLDADGLDLIFQELLATAIEDTTAVNALGIALDVATEGVHFFEVVNGRTRSSIYDCKALVRAHTESPSHLILRHLCWLSNVGG